MEDYRCAISCGKCCNVLKELRDRGGYPTTNKVLNQFYKEFFEHLEKSGVKPLFNWKDLDSDMCPYSSDDGCLIPREKRHYTCLNYKCNNFVEV